MAYLLSRLRHKRDKRCKVLYRLRYGIARIVIIVVYAIHAHRSFATRHGD